MAFSAKSTALSAQTERCRKENIHSDWRPRDNETIVREHAARIANRWHELQPFRNGTATFYPYPAQPAAQYAPKSVLDETRQPKPEANLLGGNSGRRRDARGLATKLLAVPSKPRVSSTRRSPMRVVRARLHCLTPSLPNCLGGRRGVPFRPKILGPLVRSDRANYV